MTGSIRRWPQVERLDAERVAADVSEASGIGLRVEGPCPGGQVGAAYVQWSDGHRSVLTWHPGGSLGHIDAGPVTVLEALRGSGYPAPRLELAVQLEDAVALVQELLPGSKIDHVTIELLSQALALNDVQAGVLAGRPGVPPIQLYLREDGPSFCLHEPLRQHGRRGARLEQWIREVGVEHPLGLYGDDAVHFDFHPGNLLADGNRVTGVVDWDGAGRGDRRFDLVTMRFGLLPISVDPGVIGHLDELLDAMTPEVVRPAWAHMSLRMTDWAIRHFAPSEIEQWLDLAERRAI